MASHNKPTIAKTPDDIGNPQAHFDRKKFDDFITDKGYAVNIERAMRCPCTAEGTNGQGNSDCRNCNGSGWFFIEKVETVVTCTSMSNRNKYSVWSIENMGIVNISCRPQDKLGFMDRVTLTELESWFSQVVPLRQSLTEPDQMFSFLIYYPKTVFDVFLYVSSENPLKSLKKTEYKISGNRINIDASIVAEYTEDVKPKISIRYTHNPTYHIIDINRDLIKQVSGVNCETTQDIEKNFPLNCIGKRAHYLLDKQNYSGEGAFDNTDYTKTPNYDI